jgi:hypothetical protein
VWVGGFLGFSAFLAHGVVREAHVMYVPSQCAVASQQFRCHSALLPGLVRLDYFCHVDRVLDTCFRNDLK